MGGGTGSSQEAVARGVGTAGDDGVGGGGASEKTERGDARGDVEQLSVDKKSGAFGSGSVVRARSLGVSGVGPGTASSFSIPSTTSSSKYECNPQR